MVSAPGGPAFDVTPERAIELVRKAAVPTGTELVPLDEADGRVLRQRVVSLVDRPTGDDSALDGFACLIADASTASEDRPVELELVGEVAAGRPFSGSIGSGQAVRIATGGLLPAAAGPIGVVGVEHAAVGGGRVRVTRPASSAATRPRGQDLKEGRAYLEPGARLSSASLGLAAAMGHAKLEVARRPRLVIVTTGDEVVPPGAEPEPGQLYDANAAALASAARRAGCEVVGAAYARDDADALRAMLAELCASRTPPDLILTSGGVSRGEHDIVRDLMLADDRLVFWRVSVRPAGPTLFGRFDGVPLLGLPGNPVSALVGFMLFGRAFVDAALGLSGPLPYFDRFAVRTAGEFRAQPKTVLHRAHLAWEDGALTARPFTNQSSGVLRSLVEADALVVTPAAGREPTGSTFPDRAEGLAEAIDLRRHL